MNWLHAFFGLGVALGPLTMTAVLSLGFAWRWGYVLVAAAQLALAVAFASSHAAWSRGPRVAVGTSPPARRTLALPAVWFGALAFVVYTGVEVGAGLWAYLLLTEGRGLAGTVAGICVSAYWASLFIGRLVLGEVSERLGPPRVLPASLAGMVAGAALVAMPTAVSAVAGLVLIGFAEAPVFPLLTLTTADRVGVEHADRAIGVQVASAALGVALLPSVIGVVITDGVNRLGPSLFVLTLLLCALYVGVTRFARHGDRAAETAH